jgi:hypothetical protein
MRVRGSTRTRLKWLLFLTRSFEYLMYIVILSTYLRSFPLERSHIRISPLDETVASLFYSSPTI